MSKTRAMTIRLDDQQAAMLEMVARVDDTNTTETIRSAIDAAIASRRADPEFRARLEAVRRRDAEIFDELAK